jgi:mono/diheme cytochrome c family protein
MSTPLWSDGAKKARWMIVPNDAKQQIEVTADGSGNFPVGTVFVKHFELEQASGPPHRLETRFLIHAKDDRYYGVTYRWLADNSDAKLQDANSFREKVGDQTWHYPSRGECARCHNSSANYVLGPKTAQFNRPFYYAGSGLTSNMVSTLQGLGLFKTPLMPATLPQMPSLHEGTAFAQDRARAYLDANCSGCHRPDGPGRGNWDGRFSTQLDMQKLVGADPVEAEGIMGAKVLAPQNPASSILFKRLSSLDGTAMPPLAKSILDDSALSVFSAWLAAMNVQAKPAVPVATPNLGLSLKRNTDLAVPLAGTDADGDALDFRISRMPVHGTLEGVGNDLKYHPHPDFAGIDGFTFIVSDGANMSEAGSVQLNVMAQ